MKVASVSHIRYLVFQAHLCPVGPRVLDSCSLNIRAIHIREAYEPPWARAWFILISWGHKLVWGFIYYLVLMPCFTALFTIARGAPVLFWNQCGMFSRYRQAQSHFRVPSRLQPLTQTLSPSQRPADFVAGSLVGWPPCTCFGSGKRHDLGPADIPMGVC